MEIINPKAKKYCKLAPNLQLPVILKNNYHPKKFEAIFNGFSVIIDKLEDMKNIVEMGYFGKSNFSRSYPQFDEKNILRERQYRERSRWSEMNVSKNKAIKKVIVIPDSDDEVGDYFTNIKPKYEIDKSDINETVCLSLEEAFFLSVLVQVLNISHNNKVLNSEELWTIFKETDPKFQYKYAVYCYFRSKRWVVKPGLKFGGDFLLYKEGPPFFHASYLVIIEVLNDKLERNVKLCEYSAENVCLLGLNRLCETAGKELLVCQLILNKDYHVDYNNLQSSLIKEVLIKRCTTYE